MPEVNEGHYERQQSRLGPIRNYTTGETAWYCQRFLNRYWHLQERLSKKVSDLARDVAKIVVPEKRKHFDIVVACEDEDDDENDLDVPLVSIKFR